MSSNNNQNAQASQQQQQQQYYYQNCYPYSYLGQASTAGQSNSTSSNWYNQQQQQQNYYNYYNQYMQQHQQYYQQHYNHYNHQQQNPYQFNAYHNPNHQQQQQHYNNHYQHQNQRTFNKKPKVNKRDLPENNKFFCEACDRGFKTDEKYKEHLATHRVCGRNGCKFEAADKLVQIHIRNFHSTGLDKKLKNLENDDEMKKYIEDRKKNFPTKNNVEKKIETKKDKIERGEVLFTKDYRKDSRGHNNKRLNKRQKYKLKRLNNNNPQKFNNKINDNKPESNNIETGDKENEEDLHEMMSDDENNQKQQAKSTQQFNRKPTLLERLLAPDIRHERNILLQCIRYIVKKDFFLNKM